jgi:hypothetical protein
MENIVWIGLKFNPFSCCVKEVWEMDEGSKELEIVSIKFVGNGTDGGGEGVNKW